MSESASGTPAFNEEVEDESSFMGYVFFVGRHKRLLLGFPVVAAFVALLVSFLLPKWYTATTKIMPPQQSQSNAVAILGQLGALAGGASQALGLKNPSDVYVAMLKSRTLADHIVERFDLKSVYSEPLSYYARKELAANSTIAASREGIITIEVEDRNPIRAANIANAYVEELRNVTLRLAVSEASQRRLFFENQLKKAKDDLTIAEVDLERFTKKAGLVNPQSQVSLSVSAAAALRAQISAKEVQLTGMRSFATESNPDVKRVQEELLGLRGELAKMEKNNNAGAGDVLVPFGKAPELGVEYVRKYRDMKYHETLFEVLAKQYEIARIDEAKDATLIQVLDEAVPPEQKSRPRRWLIVLLTLVITTLGGVIAAHLIDYLSESDPNFRLHVGLQQLRAYFKFRGNQP